MARPVALLLCAVLACFLYSVDAQQKCCDPGNFCTGFYTINGVSYCTCRTCSSGTYRDSLDCYNNGDCTQWSTCSPGTFVSVQGTATNNRQCSTCQSSFSTQSNQLQCTAWTTCPAGQYVSRSGTTTSDRQCTSCNSGTFTATSNLNSCASWRTCTSGQYVIAVGTLSSDRQCASCGPGSFTSSSNQGSCSAWRNCPSGQFVSVQGTLSSDRQCAFCASGSFSSTSNQASCTSWTTCVSGQYVSFAGSSTSDRLCAACFSGTFSTTNNQATCANWRTCNIGEYISTTGSTSTDRACSSCTTVNGFSTTTNVVACTPWRACTAGQEQNLAPTASTDRTCRDCNPGFFSADGVLCRLPSTCVAGQEESAAPTLTSDRVCRTCVTGKYSSNGQTCINWTPCSIGQEENVPGTTSTDRTCRTCTQGRFSPDGTVCRPWSTCPPGQEESLPGTLSTDRTCRACTFGKFSSDGSACRSWSVCNTPGQEEGTAGTLSTDRVCRSCASGRYSNAQTNFVCIPYSAVCGPGSFESTVATPSSDRGCSQCAVGFFNDASDQTACRPCDGISQFQDLRGQATCKTVTGCSAGTGQVAGPTPTSNRICSNCQAGVNFGVAGNTEPCKSISDCQPGTEQSAVPTASTDRTCSPCPLFTFNAIGGGTKCQAIKSCNATTEWLTREYTATSDRQCTPIQLCKNGVIEGTNVACTCPGAPNCAECTLQPNAPSGVLLVLDGGSPAVSSSVDPNNPSILIPSNVDPVIGCRDECLSNMACTSFFIHIDTQSRGLCFLRSSYTVSRGLIFQPGTAFYTIAFCSKCKLGYFAKDRTCAIEALPPTFTSSNPTSLKMPVSVAVGTVLHTVTAISPDGNGPVTYSMSLVGENIATINPRTGAINITAPATVSAVVALTITATDNRTQCPAYTSSGAVVVVAGGCSSSININLEMISFVTCPSNINAYLDPSKTAATVAWPQPLLPSIYSSVAVNSTLGAWQPSYNFSVGVYNIRYFTPSLDIGGAVSCAFTVSIQYGFTVSVVDIGHIATASSTLDFIIDGAGVSNGGSQIPTFSGDVLGNGLSIGILSPPKKPFSLFLRPNFRTRLVIDLQWCETGTYPTNPTNLVAKAASIELVGLLSAKPVTFNSTGSGYLSDGRCFRIVAQTGLITDNLSFTSLNLGFNLPSGSRKRRGVSYPAIYTPVGSGIVLFRYEQITPVLPLVDPGAMLSLEDKVPPQWLNCPTLPIRVTAPKGNDSAVVTWAKPDAVDNVAVLSTTASATPGSLFPIVGSPHTVTYTAYDANQAGYCIFQVYVDYEPATLTVTDTVGENYTAEVTSNSWLDLSVGTHFLTGKSKTVIPRFTADLGQYTEIVLRFAAEIGDAVALRTRTDAIYGQIDFNLRWRVNGTVNQVLALSTDVEASFQFESFVLDSVVGSKTTALSASNTMENAEVILNPSAGTLQIKGQSLTFNRGFSFTSMNIRLKYPKSRASTGDLVFQQVAGSQIGFRYFYSGVGAPASSLVGFLTLLDTERPVFETCPKSQTVRTDSRKNTKAVSWSEPVVSDNRGPPTVTSTHTSGSLFAVKARTDPGHQVVYTARDAYGNTATCNFTILVEDKEAPRLTCPLPRNYTLATGAKTFTVPSTNLRPTSILDNVQTTNFVVQTPSVLTFGVGTYSLLVTVRDDWLNVGSCTASVTIVDLEPPKVTCPQMNPVPEEGRTGKALVRWNDIQATDNDRLLSVNTTSESNTYFPVGFTTVNVSVVDASNNSAYCNFTVEVVGTPDTAASQGTTAVGAGGGAGALALLLIVVLFLLYRARQAARKPQRWEDIFALMSQFKENDAEACVPREINRGAVRIVAELGKGAFGLVCKGILQESPSIPGYLVAVKSLIPGSTASDRQELLEEAAVMAQFSSPFVVQLIGVVTVGKPLLVVLEFMELGDLKGYLEKNDVDEETRVMFAGDVCEGIHHIHTKGFLHRDIAARNVLISSEKRCKISDFGLAREQEEDTYYRSKGGNLPVRWSAPEALEERKFNHATEVWSFGIVMYEIWTKAALPYKDWHNQKVWVEVSNGYRLPCPPGCDKEIYDMMLRCWEADGHDRILFEDLVKFLRARWNKLRGVPEDSGYLGVTPEEDATDTMKRSSLFGRLLSGVKRSLSKSGKSPSRTNSVSSEFTKLNPAFEEEEPNENSALYDMGNAKEDNKKSSFANNENAALYDMGKNTEEFGGNEGDNNEASALYDMGNNKEENNKVKPRPLSTKSDSFGFELEEPPEAQSLYDNSGIGYDEKSA